MLLIKEEDQSSNLLAFISGNITNITLHLNQLQCTHFYFQLLNENDLLSNLLTRKLGQC